MRSFIFSIFVIFYFSSSLKNIGNYKLKEVFEIHFQNYFLKDTISIIINSCKVLESKIISTNTVNGYSGLKILVFADKKKLIVSTIDRKVSCDKDGNNKLIKINIKINQKNNFLQLDSRLGKYIGISKSDADSISFIQSNKKFFYY